MGLIKVGGDVSRVVPSRLAEGDGLEIPELFFCVSTHFFLNTVVCFVVATASKGGMALPTNAMKSAPEMFLFL